MTTRSTRRLIVTLCFFAFITIMTATETRITAQCENKSDAQIVADLYARIKEDKGLASQISHINIVYVKETTSIKLQGWADSQGDFDKVQNIALESKCGKINVNNFAAAPPATGDAMRSVAGCAPGMKVCGDICIPDGDSCNIEVGMKSSMFDRNNFPNRSCGESVSWIETVISQRF